MILLLIVVGVVVVALIPLSLSLCPYRSVPVAADPSSSKSRHPGRPAGPTEDPSSVTPLWTVHEPSGDAPTGSQPAFGMSNE
jgi:hypothetical protein